MTVLRETHDRHGATFEERGGRDVVAHYGKPERTHRAVRNGVGVIELGYGVLEIRGSSARAFVDEQVTAPVPREDGQGVYALALDDAGAIQSDAYVYNAGERLLVFTPPEQVDDLAGRWARASSARAAAVRRSTDDFGVFGVHGPQATEKVASVLHKTSTPDARLSFSRGSMGDAGVTVVRGDGLAGEEGFEVFCGADDAEEVFDTLITRGMNAPPFGYRTWETLTLEAGTPLFDSELRGRRPAEVGLAATHGGDGTPDRRLVGLRCGALPPAGASVLAGDESVGTVTRAVESPDLGEPIALALVDTDDREVAVEVDGDVTGAERVSLPFVEGSERSARLPTY